MDDPNREQNSSISRRRFLQHGAAGAGLFALAASGGWGRGSEVPKNANPFAYDLGRVGQTDPKLIRYETAARFACPQPDPRRIACGPPDRLYIAAKNGVSILDGQGTRVGDLALAAPARCVAVAGDGTVYAGLRGQVEVFDPQGRRAAVWEAPGKGAWLTGLAVGENDVFVADAANRVVLRYDKSGKLAGRIGEKDKDRHVPGLIVPSPYLDVALGRDGLLRVNNPGRHCVEVYTVNGDLELSWGKPSNAIEFFCGCCNPIGLALLPDGRCVTCEKGLPRVKIYSPEGKLDCVVAGPESFPENGQPGAVHNPADGMLGGLAASVDAQGRVCILDLVTAQVHVMKAKA